MRLGKLAHATIIIAGPINLLDGYGYNYNITPKFLYLFQNIPVFISKKNFSFHDRILSNFIWDGRQPWISKAILQRPKTSDGMSMPNLLYYYWAILLSMHLNG